MPPENWWDDAYRQGEAPPWDIGLPQPALLSLAEQGAFAGRVLDAGCGTGAHSLLAAEKGASVLGIDLSETAIRRARENAHSRALNVTFEVGDILQLAHSLEPFDTLIDCGLFHTFDDPDRIRYIATISRTVRGGGRCYLLCFSDLQSGDWGPRRVRRDELEEAFADGWTFISLEPNTFQINPMMGTTTAAAWLAVIRREEIVA
jgi:2-polyprenyl-3-methyl-5-hydroxy-6-metoxy-1,4-benzoquinol methylase